jgi:hypothetical protein
MLTAFVKRLNQKAGETEIKSALKNQILPAMFDASGAADH